MVKSSGKRERQTGSGPVPSGGGGRILAPAAAALAALTLWVYLPVLSFGFLQMDDEFYVYNNPHVTGGLTLDGLRWAFTRQTVGNWHPLTMLSLMLDCRLSGCQAAWFHAVNLALHIAGAMVLIWALYRLSGGVWESLFAGAVYALHPTHVESVVWISERKDVLSGLFLALLLAAYAAYARRPSRRGLWLAALLLAAGLMCKPMLVSAPLLLLLVDYWPLGRWPEDLRAPSARAAIRKLICEKAPLFVLCLLGAAAAMKAQQRAGAFITWESNPLPARVVNALWSCLIYLRKFFWPGPMAGLYPFPADPRPLWQPLLALAALGAMSVRLRRHPFLAVGWFWFLIALVPVIGLVQVGQQALADRYTYIPYIGLAMMAGWGTSALVRARRGGRLTAAALGGVFVCLMAVQSRAYLPHWQNDVLFWQQVLELFPGYARGYYGLGLALGRQGDAAAELAMTRRALEIDPRCGDANYNLGLFALEQGRLEEAAGYFRQELAINPRHAAAHNNLGVVLLELGKPAEGQAQLSAALEINPEYADALANLGRERLRVEDWQGAETCFRRLLELQPGDTEAVGGLSAALAGQGRKPG